MVINGDTVLAGGDWRYMFRIWNMVTVNGFFWSV